MEFGNSSWVNPLTSEPGGFGGVPKDAIWGHPKPGGFGGTQNAGPQPGPPGMMGSTAPTPNGLNPYQQAATNAPDAKTGAGAESFNSAMPVGGPNQYQQFPPQYGQDASPGKDGFESFAFQPNPQSVPSTLPPAAQPPSHAPAQETFAQPQGLAQGLAQSDFRGGIQPMPEARGFPEPERAPHGPNGFSAPAHMPPNMAPSMPQSMPQPRQETWAQPATFANQFPASWQQPGTQAHLPPQHAQAQPFQPAPMFSQAPQGFAPHDQFGGPAPFAPGQMGQTGAPPFQGQPPETQTRPCPCGQVASLLTVRKEGPNLGRCFWKCAGCSNFEWADEPPRTQQGPAPGQGPPPVADGPPCQCGQPSLALTVKKEGPNQGRPFFGCAQRACQFFQWADEEPPPPGPPCHCQVASVQRKVQKEGPNKGRPFHVCARRACEFFAWGDEDPNSKGLPTPARAAPKGGHVPDVGGGGGGNNSNVCFNCNQPGHWASNCPNKGAAPGKRGRGRGGRAGGGRGRGRKALGPQNSGDFDDFGDFPDAGQRYQPYY